MLALRLSFFLFALRSYLGFCLRLCVFFTFAAALPLFAQEARWKELNAQVTQLYQQGKFAEAVPLAQESLRVAEATFGPEQPNVATSLNNLAELYEKQGRYADVEPLQKRALAIREKALGPEHPLVATSLNNLAGLYQAQGRYADAEPLSKRTLAIWEKALGSEHPLVATALSNLAVLYKEQGRYAEAEPLQKRALAIQEKALGPEHPDVASSLTNLAELYEKQGRYVEAEPLQKRALAIQEKALGPEHPDVASSLTNLAELYEKQGRYVEAEPLQKRALAIQEKALGPEHPDVASSLTNLAGLYEKQGRYVEAEPLQKRALAIREKTLGPEHPLVATSLNSLAVLYQEQGRYVEAEPLQKRALAIQEKTFGPNHREVAMSLDNLATLYRTQGRYADAEPLYKRALAICEKALGPDHPDVASVLSNLETLYRVQARYADAEPLSKRALAINEKALGPDHPEVAGSLDLLATLCQEQGRYADAEPLFKRALAINEKALGPEHPLVGGSLNNLAVLYEKQGRYADAEPLFKRALAINERALGPEHPNMVTTLNNLAYLYQLQSRYADAEPLYRRALAIYEKALGPEHFLVAASLNNLAVLYELQGRYADAEPLFKRALAIQDKALGPNHPYVVNSLSNLAELFYRWAQPAQASRFYDQAFETLTKQFEYYFTYMSEKERLEFLATVQSQFPVYFSFCYTYRQQFPALAGKMYDTVLWQKGFIAQSVAALRAKIQATGDPEALRLLDRLTEKKSQLAKLVSASEEANDQKQAERSKQTAQLEQEVNELEKELVQRSGTLAEEKQLEHVSWQQVRDALKKDEAAVEIVSFPFYDGNKWLEQTYDVALIISPDSQQPKFVVLGEARNFEAPPLVSQVEPEYPAVAKTAHISGTIILHAIIGKDGSVEQLEYVSGPPLLMKSALDAVRQWRYKPTLFNAKPVEVSTTISVVYTLGKSFDFSKKGDTSARLDSTTDLQLKTYIERTIKLPIQDYQLLVSVDKERPQAVGSKFYEAYWHPLESVLGSARRVYVSTDGVLNQVSLGVVPRDDGKLLMEVYDLRIVSSTKDLLRRPHPSANNSAVLVGNPQFLLSPEQQRTAVARLHSQPEQMEAVMTAFAPDPSASLRSDTIAGRGACKPPPPMGGVLCPLPGSAVEVQSIASLLRAKNWQVATYEQENALEETVKAAQHPRVLHLSTHGFFLSDQQVKLTRGLPDHPEGLEDPMLRSGLFFAGADRVLAGDPPLPDADNGVLTAYEATTLSLQGTELVVLSACETGLGQTQAGEGVFGLRRALQEAGAESVLMSMWSVPDKETQELMSLFYEKWLGGMDKQEALRTAQLEMRERVRTRYKQDLPFYWGAFVLVGR